jgi:hypothetical protein
MAAYKACAKCRGDLVFEGLSPDFEYFCLQCGHRTTAAHLGEFSVPPIRPSLREGRVSRGRTPRNSLGAL